MSKLRFDPVTYQFYYRCPSEDGAPAKAAGFGWDPIRRRYYTEDPKVAVGLASCGNTYVKLLLADALEAATSYEHLDRAAGPLRWVPATKRISVSSRSVH